MIRIYLGINLVLSKIIMEQEREFRNNSEEGLLLFLWSLQFIKDVYIQRFGLLDLELIGRRNVRYMFQYNGIDKSSVGVMI